MTTKEITKEELYAFFLFGRFLFGYSSHHDKIKQIQTMGLSETQAEDIYNKLFEAFTKIKEIQRENKETKTLDKVLSLLEI